MGSLSRSLSRRAPLGRMGKASKYDGPAPTIDSLLWLKKLGMAIRDIGLCSNVRVNVGRWWDTGTVELHCEFARQPGKRHYTVHQVPIGACINHDTHHVLRLLMERGEHGRDVIMTELSIEQVAGVLLKELDLGMVHGG